MGDEEVIVVTTGEQVDVLDATHGGVLVDHVIPRTARRDRRR
jgi:hypothetical protein